MDYSDLKGASRPEAILASIEDHRDELATAARSHGTGQLSSTRSATHKGHEIVVQTTYEITVDGQPFDVHLTVDNGGRVHYHGLPTQDFTSTIDLVKKAIDAFPEDFSGDPPPADPGHPMAGHDHKGEH